MSYAYTDYHHHQFDRPFLSPLPMPSPKSCWYPQRQDVQFGYSYPRPEPDPPWLHQTTEYQQSTSYEPELYSHHQPLTAAYGQPPYASFDSGVNNTGWPLPPPAPAQMPEPYHHCSSLAPEPDVPYSHYQLSEELYPPVYNREGYSSNSFNYSVDDYLPYTDSWQPGPSCWDPSTSAFEQPPYTYTESYALLRIPYAGISECQMVKEKYCDAPERVPSMNSILETEAKEVVDRDVATFDIGDVSNPTIGFPSDTHGIGKSRDGSREDQQVSSFEDIFSPCSPVICGEETSMLDDEEEKGFLVHLRPSRVRGKECSYNENGDQIELLSAPCFNIVTLNELVTHSPPIGGFSRDDHLDEKELISMKNFFGYSDVEGRKMLLLEQDRDGDGQVTLNDLEIAIANRNLPRRSTKKFLKRISTKKFLKRTRSRHELLSVIAFDPGGESSRLRLSLSLVVASWFPP